MTRRRAVRAVCSWTIALAGAGLVLPAPAAAASYPVTIEAMSFSPPLVEARVGDTIVWTNKDPFPHTATAEDHGFDSGEIPFGESWTMELSREGEFAYVCTLHPTMKGRLRVRRK
jgi:plastocyanin